nr:MAG TPA: hypothetical protein [Caudoviricetes sp.]
MRDYTRHIPKTMLANQFKIVFSDVKTLREGDVVYQQRARGRELLIGHTFHNSLWFDVETLECHSIVDGRLLVKVERIK